MTGQKRRRTPLSPAIRKLRERRIELGLLQKEVATTLGYRQSLISEWERGHQCPRYRSLLAWCAALGCELTVQDR